VDNIHDLGQRLLNARRLFAVAVKAKVIPHFLAVYPSQTAFIPKNIIAKKICRFSNNAGPIIETVFRLMLILQRNISIDINQNNVYAAI
jgi:hypothetical protein